MKDHSKHPYSMGKFLTRGEKQESNHFVCGIFERINWEIDTDEDMARYNATASFAALT